MQSLRTWDWAVRLTTVGADAHKRFAWLMRCLCLDTPRSPPTPVEVAVTTGYARQHPLLGYKRLAYALMAENQAFSLALAYPLGQV